jgi:hypothetical protein
LREAAPAVFLARLVSCHSVVLAMAAVDPIHKLVAEFESDKIGLVKAADQLLNALEAKDLLYKMFLDPRQVGMDPCNRDGAACNAHEVHLLASDIAFVGFSFEETTHAVCCEVKPSDPTVQLFNEMLVQGLDLAPVPPHSIKFGSLSCGHTNMALRCIAAGVASSCPLLSDGGKMDLEKLTRRDQDFGRAVTTGLQWRVLKSVVRDDYPKVLDIIQSAKNVSGHIQRKIHEVQGMQQMHNLASAAQAAKQPVDWGSIKRAVLRSKPPFEASLDSIIQFLAVRSGGLDGHFLKFFLAMHRQFVKPSLRSSVPASLYSALAAMPCHYVAWALLQAAFTCSMEYVKSGLCGFVTAGDVNNLTRQNSAVLQEAEQILADARAHLAVASLPVVVHEHNLIITPLAKLDINMARLLIGKQSKTVFKSPKDVALQFLIEVRLAFPGSNLDKYHEIWPSQVAGPGPLATNSAVTTGNIFLHEVDSSGKTTSIIARIRQVGMDIGSVVAIGGSADLCRISSVADDRGGAVVVLEDLDANGHGPFRDVGLEPFIKDYTLRDPKQRKERHPAWPSKRFCITDAAAMLYNKGKVISALGEVAQLIELHFKPAECLEVFVKPARIVIAAKAFATGTLVLGPDTNNVKSVLRGEVVQSDGALEAVLVPEDNKYQHFLHQPSGGDVCSPAWLVSSTEDKTKANVVWNKIIVSSLVGYDFTGKPRPEVCLVKTRRKVVKSADKGSPEDQNTEQSVCLPVMINSKPLNVGDELLLFRPAKQDKRPLRAVAAITVSDLAKKAKTASV